MALNKSFDQKVREVLEDVDIEDWLSQYVDLKPGGQLSERRIESCPKCGNSSYKVYINVERRLWICHVCEWGKSGQLIDLLSELSGRTALDIYKELSQAVKPAPSADFVNLLNASFQSTTTGVQSEDEAPLSVVSIPGDAEFSSSFATRVLSYVYGRGLVADDVYAYNLRSAYKLFSFTGPFVVFPVLYKGLPVGWQGRRVAGKEEPKYVSSDAIGNWLWPIDTAFAELVEKEKHVILVEGVFDAAGLWRLGIPAFCTFGKKISEKQVQLLKDLGVRSLSLMWDADAAVTSVQKRMGGAKGLRGEIEAAALRLKRNFAVKVIDLSNPPVFPDTDKPDPGEILRSYSVADWISSRIDAAIDVNSTQFFQWRLG